jgi:hypothetical protein
MLDSFPEFRHSPRERMRDEPFRFWPWFGGLLLKLLIVWAFTLLLAVLTGVASITR